MKTILLLLESNQLSIAKSLCSLNTKYKTYASFTEILCAGSTDSWEYALLLGRATFVFLYTSKNLPG